MQTQARSVGRFLYNHNPFYLLSAFLVLYGLQTAFQDGGSAPDAAWMLAASLCGYTLLLAVTACLVVRFGRVWEDARSLVLLVIFMFVAISVSFDQICNTFPSTAAMVLSAALVFALAVSEGLIRFLKVKLPPEYRFPLYLMFSLFFLYPLWVSPNLTGLWEEGVAWRVFLFPTIAGLVLLTLIPAIRRGARHLRKNGTPWQWPWYPWPIFVFLALGVCGRSYVLTFSFQAAMDWQDALGFSSPWRTSFGLYYLTPFLFAILVLLAEVAITEGRRKLARLVLGLAPLAALTAIPVGSSRAFITFLDLFVNRLGSPVWLAVIGTVVFYAYLRERGWKSAEVGMMPALATATFIGPQTIGLSSLTEPQWWPLALIGCVQLQKALAERSSGRALVATAGFIAAATCAFRGTWFTDHYGAIPLHMLLLASFLIAAMFRDRVAAVLRQVNPILTVVASFGVALVSQQADVPRAFVLAYATALAVLATSYWHVTGRQMWKAAMLANFASVFFAATLWMHSGLNVAVPARAVAALCWGTICFCIAALISAAKGGVGRKLKRFLEETARSIRQELREEAAFGAEPD